MITVNAASNFILYCLLSDKYRKTVKSLFCGARTKRRNTISSSRFTSARTTSSFYSRSRNSNIFSTPISKYKQRGPRFSISKEEYANLQVQTAKRNRFSITTLASQSRNNSIVSAEWYSILSIFLLWTWKNSFWVSYSGNREWEYGRDSTENNDSTPTKTGKTSHEKYSILVYAIKFKCTYNVLSFSIFSSIFSVRLNERVDLIVCQLNSSWSANRKMNSHQLWKSMRYKTENQAQPKHPMIQLKQTRRTLHLIRINRPLNVIPRHQLICFFGPVQAKPV